MRISFTALCLSLLFGNVYSQDSISFFEQSPELRKSRVAGVIGLQTAGYGGSLALLSTVWYSDYNRTSFHSFDDSKEWLQMDKAGHFVTSWYLARMGINMMQWSGVKDERAILYGCAGSFLYLTGIEVLDGFSDGWGFSSGDIAANTLGTVFILGQKRLSARAVDSPLLKGISGLSLKFSFHQTNFPQYRPELLGDSTFASQLLKDYNGQTYWLSCNLASFMKKESRFPKWLNIAVGYGGEGMISGDDEMVTLDNGTTIWMERYRQYYLSLDIDLSKIKTSSPFLKTLAETFCFIKIPAPALEMSSKGFKFHSFYY